MNESRSEKRMNYIAASMIPVEGVSRRTRKKRRIIKRVNGLITAQEFRMASSASRKGKGSSARLLEASKDISERLA
jgi:stalled ribosome alternative rescue factor ArfA